MKHLINLTEKGTVSSLELVEQINEFRKQEVETTSKRKFNKLAHYDLLKIIRSEFKEEINDGKISCVTYKDSKGEERPLFYLSIEEAKQILIKESKFVRKAIIKYLNKLEDTLVNIHIDFKNKYNKLLQDNIDLGKLRVSYLDIINLDKDTTLTLTQIATNYRYNVKEFNKILAEYGIQFKDKGKWNLCRQYQGNDYTENVTYESKRNKDYSYEYMKWTHKGHIFLYNKLKEFGILPIIEVIEKDKLRQKGLFYNYNIYKIQ